MAWPSDLPISCLILVSTSASPPPQSWRRRWVGLVLRLPFVRGGNPYNVVRLQREATRTFNGTNRLPEIRIPTLILQGKKDPLAPLRLGQEMHQRIAGSKFITFAGGHLFFILRAKQFMDAMSEFLGSLDR